jgi:DivIVA domain-containing protein
VVLLLEVLVAAAILFGVVAFVAGRVEGMAPAPPDEGRPVPGDRGLTGEDLQLARFPLAVRGYRMHDVDVLLVRLGAQLDQQAAEIDRLRSAPVESSDS